MENLPVEITLLILTNVTINDIFNLRLVCSTIVRIIDNNVSSIAKEVAQNTFPIARRILRPPPDGLYTFQWLKELIPKRLASIVVDRDSYPRPERFPFQNLTNHFPIRTGIPAEAPGGDDLRNRAENGWLVLKLLSDISKTIYALPANQLPFVFLKRLRNGKFPLRSLGFFNQKEFRILKMREHLFWTEALEAIAKLTPADCSDYLLLHELLYSAFESRAVVDLKRPRLSATSVELARGKGTTYFFDCTEELKRTPMSGNCWLNWFLLHNGPQVFWHQWSSSKSRKVKINKPPFYRFVFDSNLVPNLEKETLPSQLSIADNKPIIDRRYLIEIQMEAAWACRNPQQIVIEREHSSRIEWAVRSRANAKVFDQRINRYDPSKMLGRPDSSPIQYYVDYSRYGAARDCKILWAWLLWQKGIVVDEDFDPAPYCNAKILPPPWQYFVRGDLPKEYDAMEDVPYIISLP